MASVDSIMRGQSIKSAKNCSWKKLITELEAYAPPSRRSCAAKGGNQKHRLFPYQLEVLQRHPYHQKETALLPLAEAIATSSYIILSMLLLHPLLRAKYRLIISLL